MIARVFRETVNSDWKYEDIPEEITQRLRTLTTYKPTHFTSTISDERGNELTYNHTPISAFTDRGSIANVIGHLWLKRELSETALDILNTVIILLADH